MDLYVDNLDELLQARSEIDEELRRHKTNATIFFTDVVGSTTYFDRFGDTAGLLLLHRHDSLVTSAVEEFHGMVVKTIGDSVMAEFPEPVLAVRAAVAIQQRLQEQNLRVVENERLRIRTGINYGPGFRRGNDLLGDAINLAARITKRSRPGQILISNSLREALAETDVVCKSVGRVALEGKAETEELHEVIWSDAEASNEQGIPVLSDGQLDKFIQATPTPSELRAISLPGPGVDERTYAPKLTRYEILARVGVGGMGIVFKARDRETGEIVALKVLKEEIADQTVLIEAFKHELRLARKITHKNVCRIYDFNRADGVSFITMEFVEGESLRRVLNRFSAMTLRTGTKIAIQICEGLREAHAQGIVHRDLKPENLMIDGSGNVKLMDFGLAHLVAEGSTPPVGTPSYMAPEQAQGSALDQRCDIYALGLVLFEMFTGSAAFTGDTPMVVALKQIQDAPANPRELDHTIPDYLAKAILRCLEKDPAKRFQTVEEFQAAIQDDSQSQKRASTIQKEAPRMAVVLATACVIFVLVVIIVLSRGTAPKPGVDATPGDGEFAAFHMAESLDTHESWSAFLKNYSKGELASIARERGQQLETREQKAQKAKAAEHQAGATTPKTQVPTAVAATPPPVTKPADLTPRPKLADTVLMSGGVFMMGTDSGKGDEKPLHQVGLDAFRMSPSPITNSQYFPFLEDTGHQRPKDPAFAKNYLLGYPDLPVVNVSFDEANAFCKWASNKFGVAVRLPTEAEWEFANRGRLNGNVWEWVSDFYSKDYYSTSPVKNPDGPTNGSKRVIRGGSWTKADAELANHRRASRDPKERSDQIGFRIVVDARIKR